MVGIGIRNKHPFYIPGSLRYYIHATDSFRRLLIRRCTIVYDCGSDAGFRRCPSIALPGRMRQGYSPKRSLRGSHPVDLLEEELEVVRVDARGNPYRVLAPLDISVGCRGTA